MTTAASNPALDTELGSLKRRVSDLERALADARRLDRPDTTFVLAGSLYLTTSPPYPVPQRRTYWEAAVELGQASSTTSVVVEVAVNGTTAVTITVPVGVSSLRQPMNVTAARDANLTVEITTPGNAEDLTVALRS